MALVVEDGSGIPTANTYLSQAAFETYAETQNWDLTSYDDAKIEAALVRGTRAIDRWVKYPGVRTFGIDQGLFWPRKSGSMQNGVYVADGYSLVNAEGLVIEDDEIPAVLLSAVAEAAYRELQNPGALEPDLERRIKSLKAGSVAIEYEGGQSGRVNFSVIDNLLAELVGEAGAGGAMVDLLRA